MTEFVPNKQHLREVLLYNYMTKKTAAKTHRLLVEVYGEHAPSEASCRKWFARFKTGNFDVKDKQHGKPQRKFEDVELKRLLKEDPSRTLKELADTLHVDKSTVSRRLNELGYKKDETKMK